MAFLRSISARLLGAYLVIIALPFGLLGWFMLGALNQFYLARLQDDMSAEAGLLAQIVAPEVVAGEKLETQYLLDKLPLPVKSEARVFVFDNAGRLIGSSDPSFTDSIGSAIPEPGLEAGASGQLGRGVEISAATGEPIAYAAQPILNNGQVVGVVHLSYSLRQIGDAQSQLRLVIAGAVGVTALIASLYGWQLTRSLRRPLARLSAATATLAHGDLAQRVPEDAPTELAHLARNFNQMAESLQNAETARQRSFANIAHDVRTPLGSIRAALEALEGGALDQPDLRARLMSGLFDQLNYLRHLTDELLRLATYEGSGLALHPSRVNVPALLRQVLGYAEPKAAERRITIDCAAAPGLPCAWADADRVLEILFNLLDNALRYTPDGGRIDIEAELDSGRSLVVHVRDSGAGIPAQELPRIFERYWRGDYRRPGASLNMGLGLSIVQEIVRAHGGKVGVNNLPGGGADFYFSLPVAA